MANKKFDWFAFRNETAARIFTRIKTCKDYNFYSQASLINDAVAAADDLTLMLMSTEDKLLKKIEKYEEKKKSRK